MSVYAWRLTVAAMGLAMGLFGVGIARQGAPLIGGPAIPIAVACCGAAIVAVAAFGLVRLCEVTTIACCAIWTARGATYMFEGIEHNNTAFVTNAFGAWTIAPLTVLALTATRRQLHLHPRWRYE